MLIKQIHDSLEKQANNTMRADDMTMAQAGVLFSLKEAGPAGRPLKEIEQILHVAQSTAAGIVSRLEQKGFVESFGDPGDRRIKLVRITEEGLRCCEKAELNMAGAENKILSPLTETEREIFHTLLKKVCIAVR